MSPRGQFSMSPDNRFCRHSHSRFKLEGERFAQRGRKAHSASQAHALAHYIAARAFEAEYRPKDAIAELQTYLSEEKDGSRVEAARKEMAALQVTSR